jgi:hypothetical protein
MNKKMHARAWILFFVFVLIVTSIVPAEARQVNNGTAFLDETITLADNNGALTGTCYMNGGAGSSQYAYAQGATFNCTAGFNLSTTSLPAGTYQYFSCHKVPAMASYSNGTHVLVYEDVCGIDACSNAYGIEPRCTITFQFHNIRLGSCTDITLGENLIVSGTTDYNDGTILSASAETYVPPQNLVLRKNVTVTDGKFIITWNAENLIVGSYDITIGGQRCRVIVKATVSPTPTPTPTQTQTSTPTPTPTPTPTVTTPVPTTVAPTLTVTTPAPTAPAATTPIPTAIPTTVKYVCPDGSVVNSPLDCPTEEVPTGHKYEVNISGVNISELKKQPAFEAIFAIAGILAVAYLVRRKTKL